MIFESAIFTEMILPFLFVFVAVFAILQKSKIFGENAQVDAIVGLVVGLILIGFPTPRDILVGVMPWLAVGVAVIFVFLVLYGFVAGDLSGEGMPSWLKNVFLGLAAIFTVGVVLFVSGAGSLLMDSFGSDGEVWMNVVMILIIVAVVAVALKGGGSGGSGDKGN